jgi:hypothetical protein
MPRDVLLARCYKKPKNEFHLSDLHQHQGNRRTWYGEVRVRFKVWCWCRSLTLRDLKNLIGINPANESAPTIIFAAKKVILVQGRRTGDDT